MLFDPLKAIVSGYYASAQGEGGGAYLKQALTRTLTAYLKILKINWFSLPRLRILRQF